MILSLKLVSDDLCRWYTLKVINFQKSCMGHDGGSNRIFRLYLYLFIVVEFTVIWLDNYNLKTLQVFTCIMRWTELYSKISICSYFSRRLLFFIFPWYQINIFIQKLVVGTNLHEHFFVKIFVFTAIFGQKQNYGLPTNLIFKNSESHLGPKGEG